jgi:hypothetical protein
MPGQRFWLSKVFKAVGTRFYHGVPEDSKIILIKPSHKRENPLAVTQGGIRKGNIMFTPKHIIGKLIEKFRKNCAFLNFFIPMLLIFNLSDVFTIL